MINTIKRVKQTDIYVLTNKRGDKARYPSLKRAMAELFINAIYNKTEHKFSEVNF